MKIFLVMFLILLTGCTQHPPMNLTTTKPTFEWQRSTGGSFAERFKVEVFRNNRLDWDYDAAQNMTTIIFSDIEPTDIFKIRVFGIDKQNRLGKPSRFSREFKIIVEEENIGTAN